MNSPKSASSPSSSSSSVRRQQQQQQQQQSHPNGKQYRDCVCGRGMKCTGMTQAYRMLGDPRCHYVELPRFRKDPPAYKYVFRNNLRAAYLRHLGKDNDSFDPAKFADSKTAKRRYVALHHFHPHVVRAYYENPHASARRHKVPISITEYEMRQLGIECDKDDQILSMNGRPTGGYYFVPHYKFQDSHDDLKSLIKVQRDAQVKRREIMELEKQNQRRERRERRRQRKIQQQQKNEDEQKDEAEDVVPKDVQIELPKEESTIKAAPASPPTSPPVSPPTALQAKSASLHPQPKVPLRADSSTHSTGSTKIMDAPEQTENESVNENASTDAVAPLGATSTEQQQPEEAPPVDTAPSYDGADTSLDQLENSFPAPKNADDFTDYQDIVPISSIDPTRTEEEEETDANNEATVETDAVVTEEINNDDDTSNNDNDEEHIGDERPRVPQTKKSIGSLHTEDGADDDGFDALWNTDSLLDTEVYKGDNASIDQKEIETELEEHNDLDDEEVVSIHDKSGDDDGPYQRPRSKSIESMDSQAMDASIESMKVVDDEDTIGLAEAKSPEVDDDKKEGAMPTDSDEVSPSSLQVGAKKATHKRRSSVYEWEERAREEEFQAEMNFGNRSSSRTEPAAQNVTEEVSTKTEETNDDVATSDDAAPLVQSASSDSTNEQLETSFSGMAIIDEGDETAPSTHMSRLFNTPLSIMENISFDSVDKKSVASGGQSLPEDVISLSHQLPGTDPTLRIQVHNDLIAWESKRRSEAMERLDYATGEWQCAREILFDGVEEVKVAVRLVLGSSKAGILFSDSMQTIYEDKFLDNKGNTVTNSFVQNRLMHKRSSQEYSIDKQEGDGQNQSALLDSIVESQKFMFSQFRENSLYMEDEILPEIRELLTEVEVAASDLDAAGSKIVGEMKRSEMEINKIWDVFDGMVTGDLMEYSVHGSLHGSTHGSSLHGGGSGFGGSMHGFLAPRGDGELTLSGLASAAPIIKNALRQQSIVEDGWLVETYYRAAVVYQKSLFEIGEKELQEVYKGIVNLQHKIQLRLKEHMLAFVPRQRRLFLGLPEHFKQILEDLVGLRIDEDSLEAIIDGSIIQRSHTHLKSSFMHKSSIMNRSRLSTVTQDAKVEDIESLFGNPLHSCMVRNTNIVELKPSVLGSLVNATWKTALAIVTSDGMMHILEIPKAYSVTLSPDDAFNLLYPSSDLKSTNDWFQSRKDPTKSLTPLLTINFSKSSISIPTIRKRQIEIAEASTGPSGPGSRFLNAAQSQRAKRAVFRMGSPKDAAAWLSSLLKIQKEDTI